MDPEFAWACGLFEGEGSISITPRRKSKYENRWYRKMALVMVDQDVVERFHAAVGCGTVRGPYKGTTQPQYAWVCGRWKEQTALLAKMAPMLSPRRQQQVQTLLDHPPLLQYRCLDSKTAELAT